MIVLLQNLSLPARHCVTPGYALAAIANADPGPGAAEHKRASINWIGQDRAPGAFGAPGHPPPQNRAPASKPAGLPARNSTLNSKLQTGLAYARLRRAFGPPSNQTSVCRKTPFLEFEPASAVKFDPDLTGGFRVKWTWSATFGGKRRAGGDFGAHIGDFRKYRAWRAAGSPVRAALAGFPGDVRQLFVAGT